MEHKLNRIDYTQVGLTSKNCLKVIKASEVPYDGTVLAVVGDHSGSVHCFSLKPDSSNIDTFFKTLPGPNAKISCVEIVSSGGSGSPKILVAFGSSLIRGYNKKGKQFLGLELNNLTEPIKSFRVKWPNEIYICGHYIYNHYLINAEVDPKSGSVVQNKNYYVCPEKINELILVEDKTRRKFVPILACQDRLLRVIKDSACQYEIEICGIPSAIISLQYASSEIEETLVCYGTLEGKVALVALDFKKKPIEPLHKWEIPEKGNKPSVTCLAIAENYTELYIGRSDGNIEVWAFAETLNESGEELVDLSMSPILRVQHNCNESVTCIVACNYGNLLLCSTFTGVIFGLMRNEMINQKVNPNYLLISKDTALRIDELKKECKQLENKLTQERDRYQKLTTITSAPYTDKMDVGVSALPYFTTNDSFILQDDATYLLTLEVEIAIDCVVIQSDIPLDIIDSERNSAVVSFNDDCSAQMLATFRCQANTTRLEVKIRSIEGQSGLLRAYIMTRVSPKSAQLKQYHIKPLSLHKRSYSNSDVKYVNKLTISGNFSLNEAHTWIQMCIPEIPEKIAASGGVASGPIVYSFVSTFTHTYLTCSSARGLITFQSDNVSTISILKDFITREATRKSTAIELNVDANEASIGHTLRKLYPKLRSLISVRNNKDLLEAVKELSATEPQVAQQMMQEIVVDEDEMNKISTLNLDRIYGLITDLFIDYYKLKGDSRSVVAGAKKRINEMISLIDTHATGQDDSLFVDKLYQFWGLQVYV